MRSVPCPGPWRSVLRALGILAILAAGACSREKAPRPSAAPRAGFLVEACEKAGFAEAACRCVGERVHEELRAELVDKMRTAPSDDDLAALEKHYTTAEVNELVAFMDAAAAACGIEGRE